MHAVYLTKAYHGRQVDSISASVRYRDDVDVAGYCRLTLGPGVGLINIAWGHGGAALGGDGEAYPVAAADGRRAIETIFAGYRAAATNTQVALPLAVDDLYTRGLQALDGADVRV